MQIPGGYRFYLPELKWTAPKNYPSFNRVSQELLAVVKANPALAKKHNWPTDLKSVEDWVDTYNATVCLKMGWSQFVMNEAAGAIPKAEPPTQNLKSLAAAAASVKALVAGAKTLMGWIDSGEQPVSRDQATARAAICASCPKNDPADLTKWFTVPAAELIKQQAAKLANRNISTIHDEKLHLCTACHCPLKLKVHVPIDWIVRPLTHEVIAKLKEAPNCWIIAETSK